MTAIATIRTDSEIVLAVDSREHNHTDGTDLLVYKIRCVGGAFIVMQGLSKYGPTDFDVDKLIEQLPQGPISNLVHVIPSLIFEKTVTALEHIRLNRPPKIVAEFVPSPLKFVVAGIESGILQLNYFQMLYPPGGGPSYKVFFSGEGKPMSLFMGSTGHADYKTPWTNGEFANLDLVDIARNFVQSEIDRDLPETGPPIDILRITHSGHEWVQLK